MTVPKRFQSFLCEALSSMLRNLSFYGVILRVFSKLTLEGIRILFLPVVS
jgi:hypothetical protein